MQATTQARSGPQLRLVLAEEIETSGFAGGDGWRLSEFFWEWFAPNALDGEGKSAATKEGYRQTVRLWVELTGDPIGFDQFTVSEFAAKLRAYKFTRAKDQHGRVAIGANYRPLSADRVNIHLRNLRAILNRMGPQRRPDKATAKLLEQPPAVKVPKLYPDPKDCFELSRARQIVAAARGFDRPQVAGLSAWQFWRAYLAWLYVTDVREGTLWGFEWSMLARKEEGWFLKLPRSLVTKTGKGKWLGMPDWCVTAVEAWPRINATIFPRAYCTDWLRTLHYELQSLAGIPEAEQLPPQAWRRTHAREMQRLGASFAIEVARRSLDHGDSSTTTGHYADITEELRRRLPPLWDLVTDDPRQGRLFD